MPQPRKNLDSGLDILDVDRIGLCKEEKGKWVETRVVFIYPRILARRDCSGRHRRGANDTSRASLNGSASHFCC
jgi:hypothetical protein